MPAGFRLRLVAIVLLALVPFAALVFAEARIDRDRALAEARNRAGYEAAARVASVSSLLDRAHESLVTLSAAPSIRRRDWATAAEFCRHMREGNAAYLNVAVADLAGNVIASALTTTTNVTLSDRDYFIRTVRNREFAVGGYQVGRITNQPSIVSAYPVLNDGKQVVAVVYIALDLRAINAAFGRDSAPKGTVAELFDEDGRVIACQPYNAGMVGRIVPDAKLVKTALSRPTGTASVDGLDGVRRVYAFDQVYRQDDEGLYVSVGIDERLLLARASSDYSGKMLALTAFTVFVVVLSLAASHVLVVVPLRSLRGVVARLAQGDLDARSNLPICGDEIGELAAECDAMAEALSGYVAEISRTERQYRELARVLPVGMFVLDAGRTVRFANDAGLRMLGLDVLPEDGMPFDEHTAGDNVHLFAPYVAALVEGLRPGVLELVLTDGLGRETEVELAGAVFDDDDEAHVLVVASDVTERNAVDQLKSDFLSMVSHELRTPLTSIVGFAQLLERPEHHEPDKVRHIAERIEERATHLNRLVDDMLQVLQAETRAFCGEKRPSDVRAIVESCVHGLDISEAHTVEVRAPKRLRRVNCDAKAVGHAVANLLGNAIKFSPEGGHVSVRISQSRGRTTISVADEGVGVPEEARDRIFGRFVQADMSSTRDFGGFGIGLFIVKQVAEAHGGRVTVEDHAPRGSVFRLELSDVA